MACGRAPTALGLASAIALAGVRVHAAPAQLARDDAGRAAAAFRVLADDDADPEAWLAAAVDINASGAEGWDTLRTRRGPSLSELYARRIVAMPVHRTCQLATAFVAWDASAALPYVARYVHDVTARWPTLDAKGTIGDCMAELATVRDRAGDPAALTDYATWIVGTTASEAEIQPWLWFVPMAAHPHEPAIARAAAVVFAHGSKWTPLADDHLEILELPGMLDVDAFRAHVIAALGDHRAIGTVAVTKTGSDIHAGRTQISEGTDPEDPPRATAGTTYAYRLADSYALNLIARDGAPRFRVYWSTAQRDRALARMAAWLAAWPAAK